MINIICFLASLGLACSVLNFVYDLMFKDGFWVVIVILAVAFSIWAIAITCFIRETIKDQLTDLYNIPKHEKQKKSYIAEMEAYKKEMQKELLGKYRQFEETLMGSVKDSKLIAAVLKQSGYATVLDSYNGKIKQYLVNIHSCDRSIEDCVSKMMVRQNNPISGYSFFIPKGLTYIEKKEGL